MKYDMYCFEYLRSVNLLSPDDFKLHIVNTCLHKKVVKERLLDYVKLYHALGFISDDSLPPSSYKAPKSYCNIANKELNLGGLCTCCSLSSNYKNDNFSAEYDAICYLLSNRSAINLLADLDLKRVFRSYVIVDLVNGITGTHAVPLFYYISQAIQLGKEDITGFVVDKLTDSPYDLDIIKVYTDVNKSVKEEVFNSFVGQFVENKIGGAKTEVDDGLVIADTFSSSNIEDVFSDKHTFVQPDLMGGVSELYTGKSKKKTPVVVRDSSTRSDVPLVKNNTISDEFALESVDIVDDKGIQILENVLLNSDIIAIEGMGSALVFHVKDTYYRINDVSLISSSIHKCIADRSITKVTYNLVKLYSLCTSLEKDFNNFISLSTIYGLANPEKGAALPGIIKTYTGNVVGVGDTLSAMRYYKSCVKPLVSDAVHKSGMDAYCEAINFDKLVCLSLDSFEYFNSPSRIEYVDVDGAGSISLGYRGAAVDMIKKRQGVIISARYRNENVNGETLFSFYKQLCNDLILRHRAVKYDIKLLNVDSDGVTLFCPDHSNYPVLFDIVNHALVAKFLHNIPNEVADLYIQIR